MSIYKRPDSPYYHYDFQWRGSRFHGSTGETDRRKAEAFERNERERVKRQRAVGAVPAASLSFDIAADRYWLEVGQYSKETDLEENIGRLVEWIGANTPLAEIHDDLLARLVARRRGESRRGNPKFGLVSAATVNRTVTQLLRRILTRARKKWRILLPAEPDWAGHVLKEPAERIRELSFDEEAAIETVERDDYRPARLFAQATGLRRREVVSLTWSQVDWSAGVIRVVQKGDKPHVVPITPEITDILWPLRGHHETCVFTFVARRTRTCAKSGNHYERGTRYPISYQGWGTIFARTRKKAGLKDFRIHDLRHTGATRTLRASKNLRAVKELLGHADIKTTMRYAHALVDDIAEAMTARVADEAARRAAHDSRKKSRENPEPSSEGESKALNEQRK
jgi:integrase